MNTRKPAKENLERSLQERHIQLIAIGGAIGVGLFLGASEAIQQAGPGLILSYLMGGVAIFVVMRALGEVAVAHPLAGSFSAYADMYLGPLAGFLTGWTYWFLWVITCMAEITAVGVYTHFWLPGLPQWIPALGALICMTLVNLTAVKVYGEFEFWFALLKVVTIVAMIVMGLLIIFTGFGHGGIAVGLDNLWSHDGFFPKGFTGVLKAMGIVMFAYVGTELIGVTAGEAADPQKSIPSAIDKVFWRILIFYIGTLFVTMALFPWNEIGTKGSPFVLVFQDLGIRSAAGIINFVVLTAALSSCNSGLFSTGRMLYSQALQGRAPKVFGRVNAGKVPANAIVFGALCMLVGVLLNYVVPDKVFKYVTSVAAFAALWIWGTILVVQMKSRKLMTPEERRSLLYPMPFYPVAGWLALAFLVLVAVVLAFDPDGWVAVVAGPVWLVLLVLVYYLMFQGKDAPAGSENDPPRP